MQDIYGEIGKSIRLMRKKRNLNQETLAFKIGMDARSIVSIENGDRNPTIKTIYKICKALKIESSAILPF